MSQHNHPDTIDNLVGLDDNSWDEVKKDVIAICTMVLEEEIKALLGIVSKGLSNLDH